MGKFDGLNCMVKTKDMDTPFGKASLFCLKKTGKSILLKASSVTSATEMKKFSRFLFDFLLR